MDSQPTRKPIWPQVLGLIGIVLLLPFVFDSHEPPKKTVVQVYEAMPEADKVAWQRYTTRLHEDEMLRQARHAKPMPPALEPLGPGERPLDDVEVSDQVGR